MGNSKLEKCAGVCRRETEKRVRLSEPEVKEVDMVSSAPL